MERRFVTLADERRVELEERADGKPPSIQGYASVFYDPVDPDGTQYELWPGTYERVMPGAFDESLAQGDDIVCLLNHNHDHLLGRSKAGTLTLNTFARGLRYICRLGDTSVARDVLEHVRRGDLTGSSFSFTVPQGGEAWVREGDNEIRLLTRLRIWDVSPVVMPAYDSTSVGLRAAGDPVEARASLERWRAEQQELARVREKLDRYKRRAEAVGG